LKAPQEKILDPKRLFLRLLRALQPDMVCDVGSMDGADALNFRRLLPRARILAFEANPHNALLLQNDPRLSAARIEVVQLAAWNTRQELAFFVEASLSADAGEQTMRRGISSTRPRQDHHPGTSRVVVPAVRLDAFIGRLEPPPSRLALWIDVEGGAYEVLEGIAGIRSQVHLIHVEVETRPVWQGQKLKADVVELARQLGFVLLARGRNDIQHDLVFLDAGLYGRSPGRFDRMVWWCRLISERLRVLLPSRRAA
jgi:FkbM family methyltransferase